MAQKTPIIISDNKDDHEPLVAGDTLTIEAMPISAKEGNVLSAETDGLFVTPNVPVAIGAVGCFAFCKYKDDQSPFAIKAGDTTDGSNLRYCGTIVTDKSLMPTGTWMACGAISNAGEATVFQRVS